MVFYAEENSNEGTMSAGGEKQRARFITGQVVHWQDLLSSSPFRANHSIYAPLPE